MAQIVFLKVILQIILPFTRKIIPHLYSFTGLLKSYYWNWKRTVQIQTVWPNGANFAITIEKKLLQKTNVYNQNDILMVK